MTSTVGINGVSD